MIIDLNSPWVDPNVYKGYAAFTTQSYVEINSKNGTQWLSQIVFTNLAQNVSRFYSFTTGDQPVLIKRRTLQAEFAEIDYDIFRSGSVAGGTPLEIGNLSDRNVGDQVLLSSGALEPTIVDLGESWPPSTKILGSGINKTVTSYGDMEGERVLAENTTYIVRITNRAVSTIPVLVLTLGFYEGPLDLEIRSSDVTP